MDAELLASLPPRLLAQYLRDPTMMQAQEMSKKGSDTSPIKGGIVEGLSRMGMGALGGYQQGRVQENYNNKANAVKAERLRAMEAAKGGDYMGALSTLESPDNEGLGNTFLGAKINQDQLAAQQAFNQAQQERLFGQQKDLANMTLGRQQAMQDALLKRQMEFENFKNENDPQRQFMRQFMQQYGLTAPQAAPQLSLDGVQTMPNAIPQIPVSALQSPAPQTPIPTPPMPNQLPQGGQAPAQPPIPPPSHAPQQPTQQPMVTPQSAMFNGIAEKYGFKAPDGYMWTLDANGQIGVAPIQGAQRKLSPTEQKELFDTIDSIKASQAATGEVNRSLNILKNEKPYTGSLANAAVMANRIPVVGSFIDDKQAASTSALQNLGSQRVVEQLKAALGGSQLSDKDVALMQKLQSMPTMEKSEQERILNELLISLQEREAFNNNLATQIQTGGYKTMPIGQPNMSGFTITRVQ